MKIVLANNYYYLRGGAERVFLNSIEMLKTHGHEIAPFSRKFEKNISTEYSDYFPQSIEYENVSLLKKVSAGLKMIYSYECGKKFSELVESFKPDIIHAHNIYGRLTTSIIDAAKRKNIPVVMTLHDYKLICPSYLMLLKGVPCERCKWGKFYYCLLTKCHKERLIYSAVYTFESYFNKWFKKYNWIKYFICPSKFSLRKHAECGLPEKKLVHIPNFIKIENFEPNYISGNYILFVGRLSKEKGVLTLLRAMKGLNIQLKIAGDGPMKAEYEAFVEDNGINNVNFEGYRSGEELKALFGNAAFIVFPSEWYENAPMTILEAFAYGKPVIGSNIGGIPEMVRDGETGLLFNTGSHHELKEKIEYMISNPSMITKMGKNAREKVEKEYNTEVHYQRLMDIYKKACS